MISMTEVEVKRRKAREERRRKEERLEAKRLYDAVDEVISKYENDIDIGPTFISIEACKRLNGFKGSKNTDFYTGTNLYCRQIARSRCRKRWEGQADVDGDDIEAGEIKQHKLFPDLQERYPIARELGEEPVYRLLEHLTDEDYKYNLSRMDKEIASKQKHRNALAAHFAEVRARKDN
jgi:hypothetical protein